MMATTHGLVGVLLGTAALLVAPDLGLAAVLAGAVGGVAPDLDLYRDHRRALHYPVYGSLAAGIALVAAVATGSPAVALIAVALGAAALHAVMDAFGGGLELKPWRGTSDRAVYDHFRGTWVEPRRWVRYDGAPEDLLVAALAAAPALAVHDGVVEKLVVGALALSAAYVLVRKPMVAAAEYLVDALPHRVTARLPTRFVE